MGRVGTETQRVVASAKLPDNLQIDEYGALVYDVLVAVSVGSYLDQPGVGWNRDRLRAMPLRKAQYGSDFVLIGTIALSILGGALTVAKIVNLLSDAAHKNEQRLASRYERLRARDLAGANEDEEHPPRARSIYRIDQPALAEAGRLALEEYAGNDARSTTLDDQQRRKLLSIAEERGNPRQNDSVRTQEAIGRLGTFGVRIRIEHDR